MTLELTKEGYLFDIIYKGDNIYFWVYDSDNHEIIEILNKTEHTPYLLTSLSNKIDHLSKVVKTDKITKFDATVNKNVEMLKVIAQKPTDIFDRKTGFGLRTEINPSWEDDITYTYCLAYDLKLQFFSLVSLDSDLNLTPLTQFNGDLSQYLNKLLNQPIPEIKFTSLDIEVKHGYLNVQEAKEPVIACGFYSKNSKKVLALKDKVNLSDFYDKDNKQVEVIVYFDEKQLIEDIFKEIENYPVVFTYNGDEFDLNYLYHRAKGLGITNIPITLEYKVKGINCRLNKSLHLDLLRLFRSGLFIYVYKFDNHTLDHVSKVILKEGKMEVDNFDEVSQKLVEYCLNDTRLVYKILTNDESIILKTFVILCRISNVSPYDLCRISAIPLTKSMFQYYHRLMNTLIPNRQYLDTKENLQIVYGEGGRFKAAYIDAKPGIYFPVDVVDYKSLYPTEIDKNNLSYETLNCNHPECKNNLVPEHSWHVCKKVKGIVSKYIGALRDVRVQFRNKWQKSTNKNEKEQSRVVSQALKITLLMQWGGFASPHFDYHLTPMASAIGAYGRFGVTTGQLIAISNGYKPVYLHTDSLYMWPNNPKLSPEQVCELISQKVGYEIEVDEVLKFVIVSAKANCLKVKQDGSVEPVGLVGHKRHIPPIIAQAFKDVCKVIGEMDRPDQIENVRQDVKQICREYVKRIRTRKFGVKDITYNIKLSYDKAKGNSQDYNVAEQYRKRGIEKKAGDYINKVLVIPNGAKPAEFVRFSEVDVEKYVENLLSTLSQVLEPLGIKSIFYDKTL